MRRELPFALQVGLVFAGALTTYVMVSLLLSNEVNWVLGLGVAVLIALATMVRMLRGDGELPVRRRTPHGQ